MAGLTDQGFIVETRDEIRTGMEQDFRGEFGRSIPLGNKTPMGFLFGLIADRLGDLWEIEQANFDMINPDNARKAALAALCLLSGTFKREETSTVVIGTLVGDDATVVPQLTLLSLASNGIRFNTLEPATLVALDAWTPSTPYAEGDRVTNNDLSFQCMTTGVSAGSGGPTTDVVSITDGTVEWQCIGVGTAAADVIAGCLQTGPVFAAALDLTEIEQPIGGLNTVRNLEDGVSGRDEETDEQLRLRRETDLASPGTGPVDAIRAALLNLTGVVSASVYHNVTDVTVDGIPPHSVEALVRGGVDQTIYQALWDNVAAGIQTHGTEVGSIIDSEGHSQTVKFTRPEALEVYVAMTIVVDTRFFPTNGADQIRQAIVDWGNAQGDWLTRETMGVDVESSAVLARIFDVPGVLRANLPFIGLAPSPATTTTITVTSRQYADFDTSRISITSSTGTP